MQWRTAEVTDSELYAIIGSGENRTRQDASGWTLDHTPTDLDRLRPSRCVIEVAHDVGKVTGGLESSDADVQNCGAELTGNV